MIKVFPEALRMLSLFHRILPVIFSVNNCIIAVAPEPMAPLPAMFTAAYAPPLGVQQFVQQQGPVGAPAQFVVQQQQAPAYMQAMGQQMAQLMARPPVEEVDEDAESDQSMPSAGSGAIVPIGRGRGRGRTTGQ